MNITQRFDADALLERVIAALASEGHHAAAAALRTVPPGPMADRQRYDLLDACSQAIPRRDRRAHLRTACVWLGDAFDARADRRQEEALRWAEKAAHELDVYRGVAQTWALDPGYEQTGGAA